MTVAGTNNRTDANPDGIEDTFYYLFRVDEASDLKVYMDGVLYTAAYTVTDLGDPAGGSVIFDTVPLESVGVLTMIREVPLTQETSYPPLGPFPAPAHEQALDKLTFITQQLEEINERTLKGPVDSYPITDYTIPLPLANQFLRWKSDLSGMENYILPTGSISLPIYQVSQYGTIQATLDAIGLIDATMLIDVPNVIASGTTVTSPAHVSVQALIGAISDGVAGGSTETLIINGPFEAGEYQVFGLNLTVTGLPLSKPSWFNATGDGTTNDTVAINKSIAATADKGIIKFRTVANYLITGDPALTFGTDMHINWNKCEFSYPDSGVAIQIGPDTTPRIFFSSSDGDLIVNRTEAIDHTGTETAASQLLGSGVKFTNVQNYISKGTSYVKGFRNGYYFGNKATIIETHNMQSQDCLVDFLFQPGSEVGDFTTAIDMYSAFNVFNDAFYSDVVGSASAKIVKPTGIAIDGIRFFGGVLEGGINKERKVYCAATDCSFTDVYWDVTNGGIDFEFTSTAKRNLIRGGATLVSHTTLDAGESNSIEKQTARWMDSEEIIHYGRAGTDLLFFTNQNDSFANNDFTELSSGINGYMIASLTRPQETVGDGTTTWDVTNPSADIYRYTFTGGTDPLWASFYGTIVISGGTFAAGNKGTFDIVNSGAGFFEVENSAGVVEAGVSGDVLWNILESAHWVFCEDGLTVKASGTFGTSGGAVALNRKFSAGGSGTTVRLTNRMAATCKFRVTAWYK